MKRHAPGLLAAIILILLASHTGGFAAVGAASLKGSVFGSDRSTPATGASVVLLGTVTGEAFWSEPANKNGAYELTGLQPGFYQLAIEWQGEMYLADSEINLLPGRTVANLAAVPADSLGPDQPLSTPGAGVAVILSPEVLSRTTSEGGGKKGWIIGGSAGLVALILALSGSGGDGGGSGGGGGGDPVSPFMP